MSFCESFLLNPLLVYDVVPSDIGFNSVLKMYHTLTVRIVVWFLDTYVTLSILSGWVDVSNGGERVVYNTKRQLQRSVPRKETVTLFCTSTKSTKDWSLYELAGEKRRAVSRRQTGGGISNGLSNLLDGQNDYDVCPD